MADGEEPESIDDKFNMGKSREELEGKDKDDKKSISPSETIKDNRESFLKVFDSNKTSE
jgi:hypothetical protein